MEAEDLVHDGVKVVQAGAVRELLPGRVEVWELLLQLFTETCLRLGPPCELNQSPLVACNQTHITRDTQLSNTDRHAD